MIIYNTSTNTEHLIYSFRTESSLFPPFKGVSPPIERPELATMVTKGPEKQVPADKCV